MGAGLAWAVLRFGGTASEDLYLTFLCAAAALVVAAFILPRGFPSLAGTRDMALAGWPLGLVALLLCFRVGSLPTFEARGYVRPALAVMGCLLLLWALRRDQRGIRWVAWGIVASGFLEATWGIATVLRTVAEGVDAWPPARGTFLNPNHFASWLNGCLALGIGLVAGSPYLERRERFRDRWGESLERGTRFFAAAWLVLGVMLSGSRAGLGTTLLMLACLGLVWARDRRRETGGAPRKGLLLGILLLVACAGGVLAPWVSEGEILGLDRRLDAYSGTLEMIGDHPLSGIGPGLFAWRFRPYHRFDTHKRFRHAHNDYLETAAEWGVPVALGLLFGLGWRLMVAWRLFGSSSLPADQRWLQVGAAGAAATFLVHGMLDFSLQIPSHCLLFSAVLGLAWAAETGGWTRPTEPRSRRPRALSSTRRWAAGLGPLVRGIGEVGLRAGLVVVVSVAAFRTGQRWRALELIRTAGSLEALEKAAAIDPQSPTLQFRLGMLFRDDLEHRDPRRAHRHLTLAAALNPYSWRYRTELGVFYEGVGQEERATRSYLAALALDPHNPPARQQVAAFFLRRGRQGQALALLAQAVASDPDLLESSGELLLASGVPIDRVRAWWPVGSGRLAVLLRVLLRVAPLGYEPWAQELWSSWLELSRPTVQEGRFVIEHWLEHEHLERARKSWRQLVLAGEPDSGSWSDGDRIGEKVWNGGFERPLSEGILGWQTSPSATMQWSRVGGEGRGGSTALRVELHRTSRSDFRRLRQLLAVEPGSTNGTTYELEYAIRSQDLDLASLRLQVLSATDRRLLGPFEIATREEEDSVGGWDLRIGRVEVPIGENRLVIRLGAKFLSDSEPLSGTLWLDEVSFRPVVFLEPVAEK